MSSKLPEPAAAGYGNPPVEHQFPNNPHRQRGRKRGSKNKPKTPLGLTDNERVALDEAEQLRTSKTGEIMETSRAVSRAQIKTAVLGGTNAQKAYLARLDAIERKKQAAIDDHLIRYEVYVQDCEQRLADATPDQLPLLHERMLPHPHDIEVDFEKGEVRIFGPASSLQRREWRQWLDTMERVRDKLMRMRREIEQDPTDTHKQQKYMLLNEKWLTAWERLPARYRPELLLRWTTSPKFWFEDRSAWKRPRKRRLVKNAALLESDQTDKA